MSVNNIRMAILSADNRCVGHLDNSTESGLHYFKDSFVDYLEGAAGVFTFTAPAGHPESQYLVDGNKIAFVYQNKDRYYTIVKASPSEHTIDVTAYSLCLDLINEQSPAYEAAQAMTFAQYLAIFCDEDYLAINRNEVDGVAIKHTWDGTSTLLARLYSLATVFSAEIEFLPILRADYTLERIEVNVYAQHDETHQGIGEARQDIVMQYGVNVKGIRKTSDITGLYTSIYATGKDGITISGIARTVTDSDGEVLYFTEAGSPVLYAKQARDRYPSSISEDGGYIQYSPGQATDYETAEALYGYMLGRLKVISQPAVSYEVDGYDALNVGDTVIIKDEEFQPPLYLAARVSQQKWSVTQPEQNKTTFDNFTEYVATISNTSASSVPVDVVARTAARSASLAAYNAREAAKVADTKAAAAQTTAAQAKTAIETQEQYFWHDSEGAHVAETAEGATGKNLLLTSDGMQIRDGTEVLATFSADEIDLLEDALRLRTTTGAAGHQTQIRMDVDEAAATDTQSLVLAMNRTQTGDAQRNYPWIGLYYFPTAETDKERISILANWIDIRNPGWGANGKYSPGDFPGTRMLSNGFRIVNEYIYSTEVNISTSPQRLIYLQRNGVTVRAAFLIQGAFAQGSTSLGVVIPEGFRPTVRTYLPSEKLFRTDNSSLTSTTEVAAIIDTNGTVTLLCSAAADSNWRFSAAPVWFTSNAWPASS